MQRQTLSREHVRQEWGHKAWAFLLLMTISNEPEIPKEILTLLTKGSAGQWGTIIEARPWAWQSACQPIMSLKDLHIRAPCTLNRDQIIKGHSSSTPPEYTSSSCYDFSKIHVQRMLCQTVVAPMKARERPCWCNWNCSLWCERPNTRLAQWRETGLPTSLCCKNHCPHTIVVLLN